MAHNVTFGLALGAGNAGLTLQAQIKDTAGANVGGAITTGFVDLTLGLYEWTGSIPDGQAGCVTFATSPGGIVKAAAPLNPAETENANIRTSNVWDELRASHMVAGSFGLAAQVNRSGIAQAGSPTTVTLDAGASSLDNYYQNCLLFLASGTGAGQSLFILSYAGATKIATVNGTWVTAPDNTTAFVVLPFASLMGGASLTAAAIWAYAVRTLTTAAVTGPAVLTGSLVTILRGDTLSLPFTGLGSLAGRSKLWFTAKGRLEDPDARATVQIEETGGLLTLNGAAGISGNGSLTVTNAGTGTLTVAMAAVTTATLTPGTFYRYDLQLLVGTTISTLTSGALTVLADVAERIS